MKNYHVKCYIVILGALLLTITIFAGGQPGTQAISNIEEFETRCGWFDNPTPGNILLYDRDGEWTIGVQGGYQVKTEWDWPDFTPGQWVQTNGNYGHGCICMQMKVNRQTHEVLAIKTSRTQSLAVCRQNPDLKRWDYLFK